jgi:hypothetical protein
MIAQHKSILKDLKAAKAKADALSTENGGGLERLFTPLKAAIETVENRIAFYQEEIDKAADAKRAAQEAVAPVNEPVAPAGDSAPAIPPAE